MHNLSFTNLVEHIQHLPLDEKQALHELLENYLREERRNSIYEAYQEAKKVQDTLQFSSDIDELFQHLMELEDHFWGEQALEAEKSGYVENGIQQIMALAKQKGVNLTSI